MRLSAVLLVLGGLADAAACPIDRPPVSTPPSGATLPSNPTVFVFYASSQQIRVESEGTPVPFRATRVTDWIYRLDVDLVAGSLDIHIPGRRESLDARFSVERAHRIDRSTRVSIEGSDMMHLHLESNAILYRHERHGHAPGYFPRGVLLMQRTELAGSRVIGVFADGTERLLFESEDILFELPEPSRLPQLLLVLACVVTLLLANAKAREHLV